MDKYEVLKKYYGYDNFREGQEELIDSILSGRDTLGIMPTGAGKSACYQIPALMLAGITLVISPLISLMKDQVGALNQMGVHAAYLNSSLSYRQYCKALDYARQGRYKIIYVAPERLMTDEFRDFAVLADIAMISIDEAHCVSQWGQDFRPSYLKIIDFIGQFKKRPIISAFTATATKEVRADVIEILKLETPTLIVTGFDRKNLYFEVRTPKDKYKELSYYIGEHADKSGVIYCATRKSVEEVCDRLAEEGYAVTRYHAGLSDEERRRNQDDFIYDIKPIIVATNAFGMGIDKSNVRYVVHYNMPKNMESYYQEAGRAGRDGESADCILLYSGQDVVTNQFFIENSRENAELTDEMLEAVMARDRERLKKMTYYCVTNECLREYMLRYFGEYQDNYCGNCSNCLTHFKQQDITETAKKIIGCIREAGQHFGITLIMDILHGSKSARILQLRLDNNSFYATGKEIPLVRLRQIVNHMLAQGYLNTSEGEFPVLQLTDKAEAVWQNGESISMKLPEEAEKKSLRSGKVKDAKKNSQLLLGGNENNLFERLRQVRNIIAREEKVPPYLVFSDKTLIEMCQFHPITRIQMLNISGVGEMKFGKYGEKFINAIKEWDQ